MESVRVKLSNGVDLRVTQGGVEARGSRPSLLFLHGWPSLALSWRHQLGHFSRLGFHVVAPDCRGFGGSSKPPERQMYCQRELVRDCQLLLQHLEVSSVIAVGHDWGAVDSNMHYGFSVVAAVSLNTPFAPYSPQSAHPDLSGPFDYQRYLQQSERAARELDADIGRSLSAIIRGHDQQIQKGGSSGVMARGGLLVGAPDPLPSSALLPPEVLAQYVQGYSQGFLTTLHVYNNYRENAEFRKETRDCKITVPILMITAGNDTILTPESSRHMEFFIPNLSRGHIELSSHWTMEEYPDQVNHLIQQFIESQL